jgi:hypothetical protein
METLLVVLVELVVRVVGHTQLAVVELQDKVLLVAVLVLVKVVLVAVVVLEALE